MIDWLRAADHLFIFARNAAVTYYINGMTKPLPDIFALQWFGDRCCAVTVDHWTLAAGQTRARQELQPSDFAKSHNRPGAAKEAAAVMRAPKERRRARR